jgi:hypothetical protein
MRRWPTWLVVGALVALVAVAVADALRGSGEKRQAHRPSISVPLIPGNEPASSAMGGVLYYSNAKRDCRLDGLILPDLLAARRPKLRSCRFSSSPDGAFALPGAAEWSPHGGLYAREVDDVIEVGSPFGREPLRFPGRAPAFKPDGTFTYVRGSEVVEWTTRCPPGSRLFTLTGDNAAARCRRTLLTGLDVARAVPGRIRGISSLAWLSNTRLAAVVDEEPTKLGSPEFVAVLEGRRLVAATPHSFSLTIDVSPRGGYFAIWFEAALELRDRDGRQIVFPPLRDVRALAWSPDERWTAVATRHSVYVFRTNEGEARVRRLPIEARDLAWR